MRHILTTYFANDVIKQFGIEASNSDDVEIAISCAMASHTLRQMEGLDLELDTSSCKKIDVEYEGQKFYISSNTLRYNIVTLDRFYESISQLSL